MLTVYGIPNCDSCRKARKWLDANAIEHRFHDLRKDGLEISTLKRWGKNADWQQLLNTRSQTWRSIPQSDRDDVSSERAMSLMLEHPTLIKRPVLELKNIVVIGFSVARYEELFV